MGWETNSNKQVTFVKLKTDKETKQPFFIAQGKEGDSWVEVERHQKFSGPLESITVKEREWEGSTIESVVFEFSDGNEYYKIESSFNNLSRSILNSLAGVDYKLGPTIMVSLYKNKEGYASVYVETDGERASWKFSMDELPEIKRIRFNGKDQSDFEDVNNFFKGVIEAINIKLKDAPALPPKSDPTTEMETATTNPKSKLGPDDLPF